MTPIENWVSWSSGYVIGGASVDSRGVVLLAAILLAPVIFLFGFFGQPERGMMVWCLALVFVIVSYLRRDDLIGVGRAKIARMNRFRLISVMVAIFLLQFGALIFVPAPKKSSILRLAMTLGFVLDTPFVLFVVRGLEGALWGGNRPAEPRDQDRDATQRGQ